jgi:L-fuconolactonase
MRSPSIDSLAIWRKAQDLGMFVSAMGTVEVFASDAFACLVGELPNLPIVLEHLAGGGEGASFPRNGTGPKKPYTRFKKAMELARFPNIYIKVHGLGEIVNRPNVLDKDYSTEFYGELPPLVEIAKKAFGVQRMMWGSDYPPVSGREGYSNALMGVKEHPALENLEEIEWVMGKTALKVINFE